MTPWLRFRREEPSFLQDFAALPEMERLRAVGMNCGCEYTSFPLFQGLKPYSRYDHSLGVARIVWDFTEDPAQTLAALFHDVATPTFAHSIDFLHGDHLRQESTEAGTEQILRASDTLARLLCRLELSVEDIADYHRYPIADNDSPRLSADRLEYTLGNLENYGFVSRETLQTWYNDMETAENEDREPELVFHTQAAASAFGHAALRCSRVYVSPEDRYAMQTLSELLARAIRCGVIGERDLRLTEPEVIRKLSGNPFTASAWSDFCAMHEMVREEILAPLEKRRVIPAKKRWIDPYVPGKGRLSRWDADFAEKLQGFLQEPQSTWLCAI